MKENEITVKMHNNAEHVYTVYFNKCDHDILPTDSKVIGFSATQKR